jgi:orotate phosphoribosyltransferase-like protein
MTIRSVYLKVIFTQSFFQEAVAKTLAAAKHLKFEHDFDTIAFCGTSGAAMAFILAHELKVELLCVRKKDDGSHFLEFNKNPLEGNVDAKKYLIVDDFVCSGRTVNYIIESINTHMPTAKCVAMVMYAATRNDFHSSTVTKETIPITATRPESSW